MFLTNVTRHKYAQTIPNKQLQKIVGKCINPREDPKEVIGKMLPQKTPRLVATITGQVARLWINGSFGERKA